MLVTVLMVRANVLVTVLMVRAAFGRLAVRSTSLVREQLVRETAFLCMYAESPMLARWDPFTSPSHCVIQYVTARIAMVFSPSGKV